MSTNILCSEGRICLISFFITIILVLLPTVPQIYYDVVPNVWGAIMWGPILYYALINMVIRYILRNNDYQIATRASFLGFVEAISILLILFAPTAWKQFGVYGSFIAIFHFSEFLAIAWSSPRSLSLESFILNHSVHYTVAAVASWVEFAIEVYLVPDFKRGYSIWTIGIAICLFGEIVRKAAIITAGKSFTHLVQFKKSEHHKLVTHGVYALARHPSYVGWFYWSMGTQIILFNPICFIAYTLASWKFFNDRIYAEEFVLLGFYRSDYKKYQSSVPTGLPFIKGFII